MILTPDTYQKSLDFISDRMPRVQRITQKLFNLIGINNFVLTHVEHHNKHALASLHVNMSPSTYWVENGMPLPLYLPNGFYLASQFKEIFTDSLLATLREKFSADHILFYVQHNHHSTDIFSMAADPDNKFALNNYINNSPMLLKFFLYFKQETRGLLKEAQQYTFDYDFGIAKQKKIFSQEIEILNYNGFSSLYDIVEVLSHREFQCLELMGASPAISIKSIAKRLKLSPRTVESYLSNVKNKLNCNNKNEILDLYIALRRDV